MNGFSRETQRSPAQDLYNRTIDLRSELPSLLKQPVSKAKLVASLYKIISLKHPAPVPASLLFAVRTSCSSLLTILTWLARGRAMLRATVHKADTVQCLLKWSFTPALVSKSSQLQSL